MSNEVEVIQAEVAPVVAQAQSYAVTTAEAYTAAGEFLKSVKAAQKRVTDFFAPMKQKAHEAHKAITAQESATLKPLTDAEALVKSNMLTFYREQEQKRIEAQRKAQAEADETARRERERLEKEAAKLKTPELREQRLEQAAAVLAPVVAVASAVPVINGQSVSKTWKARVVDADKVPRAWLIVNESALQAFARSTKGAVKVDGVVFEQVETMSSSGR